MTAGRKAERVVTRQGESHPLPTAMPDLLRHVGNRVTARSPCRAAAVTTL